MTQSGQWLDVMGVLAIFASCQVIIILWLATVLMFRKIWG